MIYRYFHCPKCKTQIIFPKHSFSKEKYKGKKHRKHAYCGICKEVVSWILDDQLTF